MSHRIVVVGDAHVDETQDLSRFKALKNFIKEQDPDEVVIIGDFLSLNCLSEWDKNKRAKMENRRYHKELEAGRKALDFMGANGDYPLVYIEGNHENRLTRYFDVDPTFSEGIGLAKDLSLDDRGVRWVPYKGVYTRMGIGFTHIPISANGKPIGNPNVAQKALKLFHHSVVFGHTHTLDHAAEHRHGSPHLSQALCVGCFFEHVDEYAQGSITNYWRGIVVLDIYGQCRFDFSIMAMSQLKRRFGPVSGRK